MGFRLRKQLEYGIDQKIKVSVLDRLFKRKSPLEFCY